MIGYGLPGWIDVARFLNAAETKALGPILFLRPDLQCANKCGRPATDKAHIVRKGMGGTKNPGPTVGLCRECHTGPGGMDRCDSWAILIDRVTLKPVCVDRAGGSLPTGAVKSAL